MRIVRCLYRLLAVLVLFLITALWGIPGLFQGRKGIRRNAEGARRWAGWLTRILNIRIRQTGEIGNASGFAGELVTANHHGYLDILALGSIFPFRYMPNAGIKYWPVLGFLVALNRPIWVDRKSRMGSAKVAAEVDRTLQDGVPVLAFPEGTTSDGTTLLPFKSTPFEAAIRTGAPVRPVVLKYAPACDGYPAGWFGDEPFVRHVLHTLGQPEIKADIKILPPVFPHPGESRKDLASRIREIMLEQYKHMELPS